MCAQGEVALEALSEALEGLGHGTDRSVKGIFVKFILRAGTMFL